MITSLSITSLNQGKLYGNKPTIDQLEANGAIIDEASVTEPVSRIRRLFARVSLDWSGSFPSLAGRVRG
jgi:hypothetical protein